MDTSFFKRWYKGFSTFIRGFNFIKNNSLWKYMIFPSLLSLLVGGLLFYSLYFYIVHFILSFQLFATSSGFWITLLKVIVYIFAISLGATITIVAHRSLSAILVIPFLGPLLTKVEKILIGQEMNVSLSHDIKNAFFGAWVGLKFFLIEIFFLIASLVTGPLQPVIMAIIEGYFLGRGSFDYILEKHTNTLKERKAKASDFKAEMHGLGVAQFLFLLIPIIGVFLGPAISITSAAIIYYDE